MQFDERPSKVEHLEVICDFPDTFQCHESKIVEDPTRARRLNCDRVVVAYAFDGRRAPLLDKFGWNFLILTGWRPNSSADSLPTRASGILLLLLLLLFLLYWDRRLRILAPAYRSVAAGRVPHYPLLTSAPQPTQLTPFHDNICDAFSCQHFLGRYFAMSTIIVDD